MNQVKRLDNTYYYVYAGNEGRDMTKLEMVRKLRKAGWIITHGSKHDLAANPAKPGVKITIPRHDGDIPTGTAEAMLKEAGLK